MRSDKFKAYKLRMAGKSYNEIHRLLKVPKSTLSLWFASLEIPEEARQRIEKRVYETSLKSLLARNKDQTTLAQKRSLEHHQAGETAIGKLGSRDLLILGVALYWAEGYKRPVIRNGKQITAHRVSLTNSDPRLISVFIKFLKKVCEVPEEKIKIWVRIFEHQDEAYILNFWQKTCRLPMSNFQKTLQTTSISSQRKKSYNSLPFGVVQVSVSNTDLYHKIMGLISGMGKES